MSDAATAAGPPHYSPRQQRWAEGMMKSRGWVLNVAPQAYEHPKYVLIGAFHTTNWDGVLSLLGLMSANIRASIIIKDDWVKKPVLGPTFQRLGAVGVDRSGPHDTVTQLKSQFRERSQFVLAITPEGTRKRRDYWKTGFYHIALGADVPILLGFLDYQGRVFGISPTVVHPTGDMDADMRAFAAVLDRVRPKYPEQATPMRFRQTQRG